MTAKTVHLSSATREFLRTQVTAQEAGVVVNPTTDTVQFAFPSPGVAPSVWISGSWETAGSVYYARVLVGSGTTISAAGSYDVWVRITDSPEIPTRRIGLLILE